MAVDIGPKIGIDGEAEFRKQINELTQQVKLFGAEMAAVATEFEENEKSEEALTARNEVLNKSIGAQSKKLEELKKGLKASEEAFSATDARTMKWQQAVYEATTSLNKMQTQVNANERAIESMNEAAAEDEFRKEIRLLENEIKTLGSEMSAFTSGLGDEKDGIISLTTQNEILNQSMEAQGKKLDLLKTKLEEAERAYGETDERTLKWKQEVNEATTSLNKMWKQVSATEDAIQKLNQELKDKKASGFSEKLKTALKSTLKFTASTVDVRKDIKSVVSHVMDFGSAMEKTAKETISFSDILKANLVSDVIINGVKSMVDSLKQMAEESKEYRKIMGSLEISSEQAGYTAEETADSYRSLYGVLADNQTAATTTANLQALGLEQEKLTEILNGTIGAWAKYGDSIPIDGLAESINETVKTGAVTGTFADVLNWAGTSEENFNKKLEMAANSTERANLVLEEMAKQGLVDAGEAWKENNRSLVEANEAAAEYEEIQARLGETVEPVLISLQSGLNDILKIGASILETVDFETIAEGIYEITDDLTDLVEGIRSGEITVEEVFQLLLQAGKDVLRNLLENIKDSLPDIYEQGKELLEKLKDSIEDSLPEIYQKGKDLIKQAAEGMKAKTPEVYENVKTMLSEMLDKFLDALPQMLETGGELLLTFIKGLISGKLQLVSTAVDLIGEFGGTILDHLPEILETAIKVIAEFIAGLILAIPDLLDEVGEIAVDIAKILAGYDWKGLAGDILKGLANGLLSFADTVFNAAKEVASALYNEFRDFFDIHSPSRTMRDEIGKQITLGIAEGILSKKEYAEKSAEEVASAILQSAEKKLSNYKVYNSLTLADEVAFWDGVRVQVTDGTQARIDADKKYFDAKKDLNEQMEANEKSYQENITRIHEELSEDISSAWQSYYDQVDSLADSIRSSMGLFDYFDMGTELTSDDLINNLESQVEGLESWRESLETLRDRGVSDELIEELESMGVSAAGEVEVLASMTNKELRKYVRLWEEKSELAREAAVEQLEPVLSETKKQIEELRKAANEELVLYQQEYVSAMEELGVLVSVPLDNLQIAMVGQMNNIMVAIADAIKAQASSADSQSKYRAVSDNILASVSGLPLSMENVGADTVAGIIAGMQSQLPALKEVMQDIADTVIKTAADVLDIHSPSRVMRDEIGKNVMAGFAEGIEQYEGLLHSAVRATTEDLGSMFIQDTSVPRDAGMSDMFLDAMLQALGSVQVVLEDGVLVGKLSPRIDRTIGGYAKTKERYYT